MADNKFIFLAGLHRSGTSLLHEIIRGHREISGFSDTGVPEDEGQHLQTIYKPAKAFGGPGKFAFNEGSYMDETHPLATEESANKILSQWSSYLDVSCEYIIEKSPPNLVRTRFLQTLFPNSKFIVILRHPLAVSYATKKWSKTSVKSLMEHSLLAYEIFLKDMKEVKSVYILRYEDFVLEPQKYIDDIFSYLELDPVPVTHDVRSNVNDKYFLMWEKERKSFINRLFKKLDITEEFETRVNNCGYSINDYNELRPVDWLGVHDNKKL